MLKELQEKLSLIEEKNTYLYFITRVLKPDVKKSSRMLDKFLFKVYQVDINDEIREHLYKLTHNQLISLSNKKTELRDYDVITDDTEQLFTYQMKNKMMSFADVVYNQLISHPPKIQSLAEIISNEELWAYCVGFYNTPGDWLYTFRKILPGKVAIDENQKNSKKWFQKIIRTRFNTNSQKLELIYGDTINLDKQVDCIYYNDVFYIAKKTQFEQIVGLEEEFKVLAREVVDKLANTKMIIGIDLIMSKIEKHSPIHKKLVKLSKIGNYESLDEVSIMRMQEICKQFGDNLKVKNGMLLIEDDKDIDLTLKMLSDYYKRGEVSGKAYGTFAGRQLISKEVN
ncbi:Kiwa anti-phage protein KwaB-like domain-containing protein [Fluviicola sp.]|uniref:Kiwa anti-phage protein KwaB-like domain-containing protein n=1 Tax=Fluviicola sp. TaxID=1917219 RepID=UPI0031D39F57